MRALAGRTWSGFRSGKRRHGPSDSTRGWDSRSSAPLPSTLEIRWATITSWRSHSDRRVTTDPFSTPGNRRKGVTVVAREQSLESEDFHPGQQVASFDPACVEADAAAAARENCWVRDDRRIE